MKNSINSGLARFTLLGGLVAALTISASAQWGFPGEDQGGISPCEDSQDVSGTLSGPTSGDSYSFTESGGGTTYHFTTCADPSASTGGFYDELSVFTSGGSWVAFNSGNCSPGSYIDNFISNGDYTVVESSGGGWFGWDWSGGDLDYTLGYSADGIACAGSGTTVPGASTFSLVITAILIGLVGLTVIGRRTIA